MHGMQGFKPTRKRSGKTIKTKTISIQPNHQQVITIKLTDQLGQLLFFLALEWNQTLGSWHEETLLEVREYRSLFHTVWALGQTWEHRQYPPGWTCWGIRRGWVRGFDAKQSLFVLIILSLSKVNILLGFTKTNLRTRILKNKFKNREQRKEKNEGFLFYFDEVQYIKEEETSKTQGRKQYNNIKHKEETPETYKRNQLLVS